MADPLSGSFRRPFDEQLAALELRMSNLVGTATWLDLQKAQHERAFVVAGAMKADLLDDLAKAVLKAAKEGKGLEEFRRDFRKIVEARGWHGWTGEGTAKGEAWRTKVIYQTNMATSYAAGRMAQLKDGKFAFWIYKHGNAKDPRLQHLAWDGVALPPDHPFWDTHAPPNGWGCTCRIRGADSAAGVRRAGGDPGKELPKGWDTRVAKTGEPTGIDKGWGYKVGASSADGILATRRNAGAGAEAIPASETLRVIDSKLPSLPAPIGADLAEVIPEAARQERAAAFLDFVDQSLAGPPEGKMTIAGALKPKWIEAAKAAEVQPETAEIAVRDRDVWHAFRDGKSGLDLAWYRALPDHILSPTAVLLDKTHPEGPAFLLLFDLGGSFGKLVVRINFNVKKAGIFNLVRTGTPITDKDVQSMLGLGIKVIDGKV